MENNKWGRNMFKKLFINASAFKIVQRVLVFYFSFLFGLVLIVSVLFWGASAFFDPCAPDLYCKSSQLDLVARDIIATNDDTLGWIIKMMTGFYFGGGLAEGCINAIKTKKQ